MADPVKTDPKDWEAATKLIRGGINRSGYGETAEALYLTQGFVYESAEQADARFGECLKAMVPALELTM